MPANLISKLKSMDSYLVEIYETWQDIHGLSYFNKTRDILARENEDLVSNFFPNLEKNSIPPHGWFARLACA